MKINPVAVRCYQQVNTRERSVQAAPTAGRPQPPQQTVTIPPQDGTSRPGLAVKAPAGNYAEFLTPKERYALEKVFANLRDTSRFGPGYETPAGSKGKPAHLGNIVDLEG